MRLLNLETGTLEYIPDQPYPPYAILSHTWGPAGSEITFADMETGQEKDKPASFEKMRNTCIKAKEAGIGHVWIDNFCIDKDSSAELSESINSMYNWYKDAEVCYAFLADVPAGKYPHNSTLLAQSKWFKRGWTLQELIAPREVIFFSNEWTKLGTRYSLASVISGITRIDVGILTKMQDIEHVSVAKRMSWAADRQTTRREDLAYCLMGLFNVNMPMLYGEGGEKAFIRLQEEIMKDSDDQTLFAWKSSDPADTALRGLLAKSPQDFRGSSAHIPDSEQTNESPHVATSRGLRITLGLAHLEDDIYVGSLHCPAPPNCELKLGMYLRLLDEKSQQYARTKADKLVNMPLGVQPYTIYVRQKPRLPGFDSVFRYHAFQLGSITARPLGTRSLQLDFTKTGYRLFPVLRHPLSVTIPPLPRRAPPGIPTEVFEIHKSSIQVAGILIISLPSLTYIAVVLGSKPGFGVGARVVNATYEILPDNDRISLLHNPDNLTGSDHVRKGLFKSLSSGFDPQPPGRWFDFDRVRVSVGLQAKVHAGIRYYMVDINIEALSDVVPKPGPSSSGQSETSEKSGLWKRVLSIGQ